jgi:hypothetical protein
MRTHLHRHFMLLLCLLVLIPAVHAVTPPDNPDAAAVRKVLDAQVAAWNRGDITDFMQGYKDSPSTTFVGKTVHHGYATILDRYQKTYTGKEKDGPAYFRGPGDHAARRSLRDGDGSFPSDTQRCSRRGCAGHLLPHLRENRRWMEDHPRPYELVTLLKPLCSLMDSHGFKGLNFVREWLRTIESSCADAFFISSHLLHSQLHPR